MKRIYTFFIMALIAITASAYDFMVDGIAYNLIKSKTAEVTSGGNYSGSLTIPSSITIDDVTFPVTTIGNKAFWYCTYLTSVNIPNSVTTIGSEAFSACSNLASIAIPNSVTNIEDGAFYWCQKLKEVHISDIEAWCTISFRTSTANPLNNGADLYLNDELVTDLILPNSITNIGWNVFCGCTSLTSVAIPNSITAIKGNAFNGCTNLSSVTIPTSVTTIGDNAFASCTNLSSVTIPTSVTTIGDNAFASCTNLSSVTIPNTVTTIGSSAFSMCINLNSITIPNNVTTIGNYTFYKCSNLTEVTIGNSVTAIGYSAFYNCSNLFSVTIPNSVTNIENYAFENCTNLNSVTIGKSIKYIRDYAFANCKNLDTVTSLAETVPTTNSNAFQDSYVNYATLIVPEASQQAYRSTAPWSEFGTFKTIEGSDIPEIETKKCAVPTITYENGKLLFTTETEGATIVSEIKDTDVNKFYDNEVSLTATYNITAYATMSGYDNSEVATATLVWATATFTPGENEPTAARTISVDSTPLLITQSEGVLTVSGLQDGDIISGYSTDGKCVATSKAIGNAALLNLSELQGKIAVLNVVGKSAKVMVK